MHLYFSSILRKSLQQAVTMRFLIKNEEKQKPVSKPNSNYHHRRHSDKYIQQQYKKYLEKNFTPPPDDVFDKLKAPPSCDRIKTKDKPYGCIEKMGKSTQEKVSKPTRKRKLKGK